MQIMLGVYNDKEEHLKWTMTLKWEAIWFQIQIHKAKRPFLQPNSRLHMCAQLLESVEPRITEQDLVHAVLRYTVMVCHCVHINYGYSHKVTFGIQTTYIRKLLLFYYDCMNFTMCVYHFKTKQ